MLIESAFFVALTSAILTQPAPRRELALDPQSDPLAPVAMKEHVLKAANALPPALIQRFLSRKGTLAIRSSVIFEGCKVAGKFSEYRSLRTSPPIVEFSREHLEGLSPEQIEGLVWHEFGHAADYLFSQSNCAWHSDRGSYPQAYLDTMQDVTRSELQSTFKNLLLVTRENRHREVFAEAFAIQVGKCSTLRAKEKEAFLARFGTLVALAEKDFAMWFGLVDAERAAHDGAEDPANAEAANEKSPDDSKGELPAPGANAEGAIGKGSVDCPSGSRFSTYVVPYDFRALMAKAADSHRFRPDYDPFLDPAWSETAALHLDVPDDALVWIRRGEKDEIDYLNARHTLSRGRYRNFVLTKLAPHKATAIRVFAKLQPDASQDGNGNPAKVPSKLIAVQPGERHYLRFTKSELEQPVKEPPSAVVIVQAGDQPVPPAVAPPAEPTPPAKFLFSFASAPFAYSAPASVGDFSRPANIAVSCSDVNILPSDKKASVRLKILIYDTAASPVVPIVYEVDTVFPLDFNAGKTATFDPTSAVTDQIRLRLKDVFDPDNPSRMVARLGGTILVPSATAQPKLLTQFQEVAEQLIVTRREAAEAGGK